MNNQFALLGLIFLAMFTVSTAARAELAGPGLVLPPNGPGDVDPDVFVPNCEAVCQNGPGGMTVVCGAVRADADTFCCCVGQCAPATAQYCEDSVENGFPIPGTINSIIFH